MENKYKLTQEGLTSLQAEIAQLKDVDRIENLEALKEARAQGDLSENADYDAARDKQAEIEGRIKEIEGILKNYELIKEDSSNIVNIGKKIVIQVGNLPEKEYVIVGSLEANPLKGKISNESPIGKGIIGLSEGAEVTVKTETGQEINVKVVKVN
jgi:transcription elongation factor GreA